MIFRTFKSCIALYLLLLATGFWADAQVQAAQPETKLGSANTGQGPTLQLPETQFDFGEASETGEVAHDFVVRNTGTQVLQIQQVRPG
ncbi:DUF1573 domain-containing protein [Syntrophobacteraceae bacterium DRH4]|nr:DUF1573 domain-containing protein [Desulfoferrobacter suflitae]